VQSPVDTPQAPNPTHAGNPAAGLIHPSPNSLRASITLVWLQWFNALYAYLMIAAAMSKTVTATNALTAYAASTRYNYLTGTAGASFAATLPPAAANIDGQVIGIMSSATRVSTTWVSAGATFVGAPGTLTAGVPVKFQYDQATLAWYITD
jgi:hypothetical protein